MYADWQRYFTAHLSRTYTPACWIWQGEKKAPAQPLLIDQPGTRSPTLCPGVINPYLQGKLCGSTAEERVSSSARPTVSADPETDLAIEPHVYTCAF